MNVFVIQSGRLSRWQTAHHHPSPGQHKNCTIKEINQQTVATILHIVSFKNAFTKHILKNNKNDNYNKQSNPFSKKWRWWMMSCLSRWRTVALTIHAKVCVEGCCVCVFTFIWTCENVKHDQLKGYASQMSPNYHKSALFTAEAMPPPCGHKRYCGSEGRPNCVKNYKFVWILPQFWTGTSIRKIFASIET